jgi:NAD(P)-dependent dehydrogenase (short-subunit alcohol dehydrogenase family)
MRVHDRVVVMTGAAGIGPAMALRYAADGAARVTAAGIDEIGATRSVDCREA